MATPVFDTYWRFATKRQDTFMRRVLGDSPPWTDDPVISAHRFTNAYRASDRVSQYLIRHVQYKGDQSPSEIFFRTLIFKIFNKIETWEYLVDTLGEVCSAGFPYPRAEAALDSLLADRDTVYSAAYIMPSPAFGAVRKHANHLRLIEHMMRDRAFSKVEKAPTMEATFNLLRSYPSLGDFLAFQLTIDLNYSRLTDFSEMDFVVAGPGARDGIKKCFSDTDGLSESDVIRAVADIAGPEFERLGIGFQNLWGRDLQLIDCQNLFCEVGKYARLMHPEFPGASGRTRIKQRFVAALRPVPQWYPPKWNVHPPEATTISHRRRAPQHLTPEELT
jgi:alpha-glutamyl/putrescinyl thymine pyrophosphorylase clade 1